MSPGILGKKIGMTQVFRADGQVVPVTVLKAGPCVVVQRKTPAIDGYDAVQLGLMEYVKKSRINKPDTGHLKKSSAEGVKFLREFRLGDYMRTLRELCQTVDDEKLVEDLSRRLLAQTGHENKVCGEGRVYPSGKKRKIFED